MALASLPQTGGRTAALTRARKARTQGLPQVGVLDSSELKPLLTADAAAVFAPPDLLLFAREQTLLAQRFDPNRLALVGEPVPVADAIPSQTGMPAYSVSETGVLTYRTIRRQSTQLAWLDRDGRLRSAVGPVGDFQDLALSPDETHVAVTNRQDGEIWMSDT